MLFINLRLPNTVDYASYFTWEQSHWLSLFIIAYFIVVFESSVSHYLLPSLLPGWRAVSFWWRRLEPGPARAMSDGAHCSRSPDMVICVELISRDGQLARPSRVLINNDGEILLTQCPMDYHDSWFHYKAVADVKIKNIDELGLWEKFPLLSKL